MVCREDWRECRAGKEIDGQKLVACTGAELHALAGADDRFGLRPRRRLAAAKSRHFNPTWAFLALVAVLGAIVTLESGQRSTVLHELRDVDDLVVNNNTKLDVSDRADLF